MQITFAELEALPLPVIRQVLPGWVAAHLNDPELRPDAERQLSELFATVDDAALQALRVTFFGAGAEWRFHEVDRTARSMTRMFMGFLLDEPVVEGAEHLTRFMAEGPHRRFIVCNHLSYTDTQVTDRVLYGAGHEAAADRIVAIAGPKVYTDPWRRLAAISLNTRKTPQSNVVATEQDALSPRELAAIAFAAIDDCVALADRGYVPLLYPEGARSRSGHMRPFLRAGARYLAQPDVQILPLAQTGTERVFPIGETTMNRGRVRLRFGAPFLAADYPGKTGPIAEAFRRVAAVLPPDYAPDAAEGELI